MTFTQHLRAHPDEHLALDTHGDPIDIRLTLDPSNGNLFLNHHHTGDATPISIHNRSELGWIIPGNTRGDALADWLEQPTTKQLLLRICAGHTLELDAAKSNLVGRLTPDAQAAEAQLDAFFERQCSNDPDERPLATYEVWRAGDYLNDTLALTPELRGSASDEQVDALAREIIEEAATNGVWLDPSDVKREIRAEIDRASVTKEQHA